MQNFPHLGSKISIGNMELKNRMVMSPMTTAYCNDDQTPNDRLIRYFEERAKGGVGLITMELITVDEEHRYMHRSMTLGDDRYIDGHRRITEAIHQHGAKVQPQLSHTGPESVAQMFGGAQGLGPSVNVAPVWGWASRELKAEELPAIAVQYGEAARRAREAGYDGIELHAAHCYNLLGSFLSPLRNKRTDDYSAFRTSSRTRFIREVLAEIKARAGNDFPITLSISGYERFPGGRALDDSQHLAPELVAAGVDCFRVSGGISDSLVTMMVNRSEHGPAVNLSQAEAIRNVVDVPVMLVGRIHDPELAERIIADGQADLIAMARPLLADPWLPSKVLRGRPELIRRCISCQNCIDSMQTRDNLGCAVNPLSGREAELGFVSAPKKIVVIGAGAAGLEAARLAAETGHRVVLIEKQRTLGGSLLFASTVHKDNQPFLDWLIAEVKRLPIDIRLGLSATADVVTRENPDAVFVATGARVQNQLLEGIDSTGVRTGALIREILCGDLRQEAWRFSPLQKKIIQRLVPRLALLLRPALLRLLSKWWMPVGRKVILIGADLAAVELAEFLAERGRHVQIVSTDSKLIPEVGKKRRHEHMDRLDNLKVTVNTAVVVESVSARNVRVRVASGGERTYFADTVIVAGQPVADTSFVDQLVAAGLKNVVPIGDCTGLGLIAGATQSAAEAVNQLGTLQA